MILLLYTTLPFFTIHLLNFKRYMFCVPFDLSLLITFNWLIAINLIQQFVIVPLYYSKAIPHNTFVSFLDKH